MSQIKPITLNERIGDENYPTFILIYFSENVCGIECVGRPNETGEEPYWLIYDNLLEAVETFADIPNYTPEYFKRENTVIVGPYRFLPLVLL